MGVLVNWTAESRGEAGAQTPGWAAVVAKELEVAPAGSPAGLPAEGLPAEEAGLGDVEWGREEAPGNVARKPVSRYGF